MGVVIETSAKYPGGPTRITVTDMYICLLRTTLALRSNQIGHQEASFFTVLVQMYRVKLNALYCTGTRIVRFPYRYNTVHEIYKNCHACPARPYPFGTIFRKKFNQRKFKIHIMESGNPFGKSKELL
jgi:hypothetical protein